MRIPNHIGIIPDGNRRWAENSGLQKQDGYSYGLDPGLKVLRLARDYGIKEISYYGFTTDNCKRPPEQIDAFRKACLDAIKIIAKENVSLLVVGNYESKMFPKELLQYKSRTKIRDGGIKVNFLVNYGWEWDLSGDLQKNNNRKKIYDSLKSKDISRIDMIIRWGGRRRLSGFLPVQSVYADFYVIDDLWPDFKDDHFHQAIQWYNGQDVTLGG
ncbi:MAG: polyprenyl diphosphate synthase [Bacillota bacterium]|jgi:undecaprenyl diphosphate synthase